MVTGSVQNDELLKYKQSFTFWQKLRRSVKIRYFDAIDNKEYEPLMQNLLDSHLSVAGLKQITARELLNKSPEQMMMRAVKGMLPHNSLGRQMLKKLRVYAGEEHENIAQKPEVWNF